MIKAAIIDDGVNPLQCPSLRQAQIVEGNSLIIDTKPPEHSHGTTCLSIIEHYLHNANVIWHSIRILNQNTKRGNLDSFLCALNHCTRLNVRLVHLSIGSSHYGDFRAIQSVIKRLTDAGIIIVAALNNSGTVTYPACLDNVIGVMCDPNLKDDTYITIPKTFMNIDFCASSVHDLYLHGVQYTTPLANSFAAPLITAKVIFHLMNNLMAQYDDIYHLLVNGAARQIADIGYLHTYIKEFNPNMPPVVAFVGYYKNEILDVLLALERKFEENEYYCTIAVEFPYDIPSGFVKILNSLPIDTFVEKVCYFYCCSILLLAIEKIDLNNRDNYGFVDIFFVPDKDMYNSNVLDSITEQKVFISDRLNADTLFSQIIASF